MSLTLHFHPFRRGRSTNERQCPHPDRLRFAATVDPPHRSQVLEGGGQVGRAVQHPANYLGNNFIGHVGVAKPGSSC